MNKELNKKLAKWAGFKSVKCKDCYAPQTEHGREHPEDICHYEYPDDEAAHSELPDFTQSLDTCFKRLVPRLREKYYIRLDTAGNYWRVSITPTPIPTGTSGYASDKDPALALCLAVEKLIDGR